MDNANLPLVSVPVVTYNSSKTIIETLDSIYNQTYPYIELIVSDDCSTDNTVELVRSWVKKHEKRFTRTEIITVEKNTGISANFNRAESVCHGIWIKAIAGDDILLPICIEECISFALKHPNCNCIFGKIIAFGNDTEYCQQLTKTFSDRIDMMANLAHNELAQMVINGELPPAPTFFYKRSFFIEKNITNDERMPLVEDWAKWINILETGEKFYFIKQPIVKYRVGGISHKGSAFEIEFYKNKRKVYFYYVFQKQFTENAESAIEQCISQEVQTYKALLNAQKDLTIIQNSITFKIGNIFVAPFRFILNIIKR